MDCSWGTLCVMIKNSTKYLASSVTSFFVIVVPLFEDFSTSSENRHENYFEELFRNRPRCSHWTAAAGPDRSPSPRASKISDIQNKNSKNVKRKKNYESNSGFDRYLFIIVYFSLKIIPFSIRKESNDSRALSNDGK